MTDADIADAPSPSGGLPRPHTQDGPAVRLYLVDGSGYIFRAYHALPPLTRKSDGLPVGAVAGFCNMLWKFLGDMRNEPEAPTHLAVIFDHSEKTFRNDLYPEYKAHRPPAPEDLVPQFPLVREATKAFGVPCIELAGYEADDLIASYAKAVRDAGGEAVIVSSDKDLMQLVGEGVSMFDTMKNLRIGPEQVAEKFGVPPDKVVDVQALCGDSVDNVPGAPGIGVKTAALLDQRIRRPGLRPGPRRRGQTGQAPPDPDRVRRPDPPVARAGEAHQRRPPARAAGRPGHRRSGRPDARRLPGEDGVQHPGPPGGRRPCRARARRGPARRRPARAQGSGDGRPPRAPAGLRAAGGRGPHRHERL